MISAIVLAAGTSQRMGTPKSLLKLNDTTFLRHIVEALQVSRILDIVTVLGSGADEIRKQLGWFEGKAVINENWQHGQLSSIICGLHAVEKNAHGVMMCPVDHPLISHALVVDLLQAYWTSHKKIIVPVYEHRRGHPVIFSAELFDELRNAPTDVGARAVVHNHSDDVLEVPTNEQGVVLNIDTPEDYETKILHRVV